MDSQEQWPNGGAEPAAAVAERSPSQVSEAGGEDPLESAAGIETASVEDPVGSISLAVTEADCNREHIECFRRCWNAAPPWPIERGKAGHYKYCQSKCLAEYMACLAAAGALRIFATLAQATEWLRRNPGVAVGTLVVVAGVAYVVSTGGAGALILLPAAA